MANDKTLERGYGSDTDINVLDREDETTGSVRTGRAAGRNTPEISGTNGGKSSDVGGYGMQSKAGVLRDTGGSATASAKKSGNAGVSGEKAGMAGFTGVSGGVTGSGVGTSGLAERSGVEDEKASGLYVSGDGGKEGVSSGDLPRGTQQSGGAEGGSVVTSGGKPTNASDHATHSGITGGRNDGGRQGSDVNSRSAQGQVKHNAPGSGAE